MLLNSSTSATKTEPKKIRRRKRTDGAERVGNEKNQVVLRNVVNTALNQGVAHLVKRNVLLRFLRKCEIVFFWSRVSGIKLPYVGQLCHPRFILLLYFLCYFIVWYINK